MNKKVSGSAQPERATRRNRKKGNPHVPTPRAKQSSHPSLAANESALPLLATQPRHFQPYILC